MKTECGIIQDLLPLYVDGICSPESQAAVAQHLQECDVCRERHRRMTAALPEQAEPEELEKGRVLRRGLRKVRRRWILSLVAALLAVPLLLMSIAQITGDGICFTNLGQIVRSYHFLSCLKNGHYEKAFDMLDMEGKSHGLQFAHGRFRPGGKLPARCHRRKNLDVFSRGAYSVF